METDQPLRTARILREEYRVLRPDFTFQAEDEAGLSREIDAAGAPLSALCISGGGIRSATFALGALQGLAESGLLNQFDYLSTVSGGGYIGGWLTAWIQRAGGIDKVVPRLRACAPPSPEGEPDPTEHLREYNNYLTPRLGAFCTDTWVVVATVFRNMLLNWLVLVPLLMALLAVPRIILALADGDPPDVAWISPIVSCSLLCMGIVNSLRYLPGVGGKQHTEAQFLGWCLGPLVASSLSVTVASAWVFFQGHCDIHPIPQISICVGTCLISWLIYLLFFRRRDSGVRLGFVEVTLAMLLLGGGIGGMLWVASKQVLCPATWGVYITVGPPLMLGGFALAACLFTGITTGQLQDDDREWLSRAGAWLAMFIAVWLVSCALVLVAPRLIFHWSAVSKAAAAAVGALSGWASALTGYSAKSKERKDQAGGEQSSPLMRLALKLAAPLFIASFLVGLGVLTNALVASTGLVPADWTDHEKFLEAVPLWLTIATAAVFLALGTLMARYININVFSLHAMYRNRLIRAYLGASNAKRNASNFTGFASSDNIKMTDLNVSLKPLHIVNLTLNLVAGERLAWQQRKAASFTVSGLYCGSNILGYRTAAEYGTGISLGTAITISGAAASPSMGYHSSPLIGFIMTLFNARLGSWLGNPGSHGEKTWKLAGPRTAANSLLREAMGLTHDRSPYVYLSDGGHFENLGMYEMVMRRCKRIVVLDSGCDPEPSYEDLGNALRKIRIDFRVPIVFDDDAMCALRERRTRWAVARIVYSAVDDQCADGELLYIKPALLGNEPPDVSSYHKAHPAFPHESTADQWFNESQTESYRMLGMHTVAEICRDWQCGQLSDLFRHLSTPGRANAARSGS